MRRKKKKRLFETNEENVPMNVYFVIYFVYGNNRIMECDRICIYRIYRNFGIVIEQRARTINFRSTNFLTHVYSHIHSFTDTSLQIFIFWFEKTKILIFLIFFTIYQAIRKYVFLISFLYLPGFESYISRTFTFDLITIIEISSRVTFPLYDTCYAFVNFPRFYFHGFARAPLPKQPPFLPG